MCWHWSCDATYARSYTAVALKLDTECYESYDLLESQFVYLRVRECMCPFRPSVYMSVYGRFVGGCYCCRCSVFLSLREHEKCSHMLGYVASDRERERTRECWWNVILLTHDELSHTHTHSQYNSFPVFSFFQNRWQFMRAFSFSFSLYFTAVAIVPSSVLSFLFFVGSFPFYAMLYGVQLYTPWPMHTHNSYMPTVCTHCSVIWLKTMTK